MEDVLDVYTRAPDPQRPLVCLDETSKQLSAETRQPLPLRPGLPARHDYEYKRNGTANLFMLFAPLEGWRHVEVTARRTAIDYAHILRDLADIHFPKADKILLVQDNLNTHKPASRLTKPSNQPKPAASSSALNGTTRQSMAHGSIWQNPNWPSSPNNASTAASKPPPNLKPKSTPGEPTAMPATQKPTGTSVPTTHASNSKIYIQQFRGFRPLVRFGKVWHPLGIRIENGRVHAGLHSPVL